MRLPNLPLSSFILIALLILTPSFPITCADGPQTAVQVVGCTDEIFSSFMNLFSKKASKDVHQRMNITMEECKSNRLDNMNQVQAGKWDFFVSSSPIEKSKLSGNEWLHFPIGTTGVTIVANVFPSLVVSLSPSTVADIFSGRISRWNDASIATPNPKFSNQNIPIIPIIWGIGSADHIEDHATTEVKRFMQFNAPAGKWTPSTSFSPQTVIVASYQEAVSLTRNTTGAITYAPFTRTNPLVPFQLYVDAARNYVQPNPTSFLNSLMPIKLESDLLSNDASNWDDFTLTDMNKMPPGRSCMSMPPYPLSRFVYLITKKDWTLSQGKSWVGAAVGAFVRLISSPDYQSLTNQHHLASIPIASQTKHAASVASLFKLPQGESIDSILKDVKISEASELTQNGNSDMGDGMNSGDDDSSMKLMQPAPLHEVILTMTFLLLSGLLCVIGYLMFLKFQNGGTLKQHALQVLGF